LNLATKQISGTTVVGLLHTAARTHMHTK